MKSINLILLIITGLFTEIHAQNFSSAVINPFSLTQQGNRTCPAFVDIDNDSDFDLFTGFATGDFGYFENTGTSMSAAFGSIVTPPFGLLSVGGDATPFFVDIDNDNDFDLLTGSDNSLKFYENTGASNAPVFSNPVADPYLIISPSGICKPYMADIDNDGDKDLFVGATDGNIYYYENTGSINTPAFAAAITNPFGLTDVGVRSAPSLADLDNDGDFDLLIGAQDGNLYYFENTGTVLIPAFSASVTNPFNLSDVGSDSKPYFADIDNDGDVDLMVGNALGEYYYFQNIASTGISEYFLTDIQIFPNPVRQNDFIRLNGLPVSEGILLITDLFGRTKTEIKFAAFEDNILVNCDKLVRGAYVAYVMIGTHRLYLDKLIVQ